MLKEACDILRGGEKMAGAQGHLSVLHSKPSNDFDPALLRNAYAKK